MLHLRRKMRAGGGDEDAYAPVLFPATRQIRQKGESIKGRKLVVALTVESIIERKT